MSPRSVSVGFGDSLTLLELLNPLFEISFGAFANLDNRAAPEERAACNPYVAAKVRRQEELTILDDGNLLLAKMPIEVTELENHVEIRYELLLFSNFGLGLRRKDHKGSINFIANGVQLVQKCLAGSERFPPGQKLKSVRCQGLYKRLSLRLGCRG
jgi:hypothetical protein